jgi:hypothetical protein
LKADTTQTKRFLGIFVHPLYVQNEGIQQVFDNLKAVGASAISISPLVARPAAAGKGRRFPDLAKDGYARVVARPVWGKTERDLEFFLVYEPNLSLYEGGAYKPLTRPIPSDVDRDVPRAMIAEAKKRGIQVHIQIHPLLPPNLPEQDQSVYPDGSVPQPPQYVFAPYACPNNPSAKTYGSALVEDTIQHLPNIDGLFTDFVEYGAYSLEDHFSCFCQHCERKAREQGFDWDVIKRDVTALWNWLHSLTPRELERSRRLLCNPSELVELLAHNPGWLQFLDFKAKSVVGFYRQVRQLLDKLGAKEVVLSARGWPPPWNRSSGMDYRALAEVCTAVTPKLFSFAYSALPRWYGQTLLTWNPELSESEILDALVEWMNLPDDIEGRSFGDYHVPAPTELQPAKAEVYRSRLDEVMDQVAGKANCYPFAHAYLPEEQWKRMIAVIRDSRVDGMWVQMYAYLSDRKLEILREMWS